MELKRFAYLFSFKGERLNHAVGCAFEACRHGKSQFGPNNNKIPEETTTDAATSSGAARHREPIKHHAITTGQIELKSVVSFAKLKVEN
jgi:hypothetical protein